MTRFAKKLLLIILLVVFAIFALRHYFKNSENKTKVVTEVQQITGCYVAKLSKDIYTLILDKQEGNNVSGILAYNNWQKDSSSGLFKGIFDDKVLLGNYLFDSEGIRSDRQVIFKKEGEGFIQGFGKVKVIDNKETLEDISTVSYDPNSTFTKSANCSEDFTDSAKTFTFSYNPFFKIVEVINKKSDLDWKNNAKQKGVLLASVFVPKAFISGKNFSGSKLTIGKSSDVNAISGCITGGDHEDTPTSISINGYPFTRFISTDAGAGNFYDTTSYRGIVDGDCYALEYTIHSTNIENYPPDAGVKEFSKNSISDQLDMIIKNTKFLINSN